MQYAGEAAGPKTDMSVSLDPRELAQGVMDCKQSHDPTMATMRRDVVSSYEFARWDLDSHIL